MAQKPFGKIEILRDGRLRVADPGGFAGHLCPPSTTVIVEAGPRGWGLLSGRIPIPGALGRPLPDMAPWTIPPHADLTPKDVSKPSRADLDIRERRSPRSPLRSRPRSDRGLPRRIPPVRRVAADLVGRIERASTPLGLLRSASPCGATRWLLSPGVCGSPLRRTPNPSRLRRSAGPRARADAGFRVGSG